MSGEPADDPADDQVDPLDRLTQEYLRRHRAGGVVSVEDFAQANPEHAGLLRELLPTLLALETAKRERQSSTGGARHPQLPQLERLGDFRIVRELGRGGMGVVFEAVQEALDRRVALKVLPQAALLTERQLSRFRREAHIAAQLHHSNIVPVFGSGESDGFHWYAMQFIAGQSLDRWREEEAKAPPAGSGAWRNRARFVARLGEQAALALHHAHGHGTLHRDIKPGNLLLDRDDNVWVTDFGLAKALEEEGLTHSGDLLGTLQYMAPEQFAGQYDVRSEVYALGITLYELLALRPAYAAKTRSELLERIRTQSPTDLRRHCPDLPEDLAMVVECAIARDPADRYQDAAAFARDLAAFLEDRPIAARRQSSLGLLLRWCRRNKPLASLAAATLVAVVGAAVTGWIAYGVTDDALTKVKSSATLAQQQSDRAEANLRLSLSAFAEVFEALVGRDRVLAFEEDPDTGEAIVVTPSVRPQNVALLEKMLRFYDAFATQNEDSQSLRLDTARAYRRVAAIQGRFGKLDEAAAAYEQSLDRYQFVTERDVTREIAAVQVDYGQLEQRRGRMAEAGQRFRRALQLLEGEQLGDGKLIRFERAEVHFLLARAVEFRRRGPESGQPPPSGSVGRVRELMAAARQHLDAARELLAQLLVEDPDNPDFRALQARSLCFGGPPARPPGGRPDEPRDTDQRDKDLEAGLAIFRDLVARFPDNEDYRLELCNVLAGDLRRTLRGGRTRGEGAALDTELANLREAKEHAEVLLQRQPDYAEYKALRGRIGAGLGFLLRVRAGSESGPQRDETRTAAITELRQAVSLEPAGPASTAGRRDPRSLLVSLSTRMLLAQLLLEQGDAATAQTEFTRVLDAIELELNRPEGEVGLRPDPQLLAMAQRLAERLALPALSQRLDAIKERLPAPDRGSDRPGERPRRPR